MTIHPRPKTQTITTDIPEHLVEAFLETTTDFLANARGGKTASQRAAEVRAQDKDQGLDSLEYLLRIAERDTGNIGRHRAIPGRSIQRDGFSL